LGSIFDDRSEGRESGGGTRNGHLQVDISQNCNGAGYEWLISKPDEGLVLPHAAGLAAGQDKPFSGLFKHLQVLSIRIARL
jgi:hypothetical protein